MKDDPEYVRNLPLVFVDTETSGLETARHGLLEIAAIRTTPDASSIISMKHSKMALDPGLEIDPRAAEINGYTPEAWKDAPRSVSVLTEIYDLIRGAVWIGHTPRFDYEFIQVALARNGVPSMPLGWRYIIDTAVLSWPLLKAGKIPNLKLTTITAGLGLQHDDKHSALGDAMACLRIYRHLMGIV